MKPLDSEKNLTFMNHPERVAAQKELDEAVLRISTDIKVGGSAMYYLTILPPILKKLEAAVENLNIVEAKIIAELQGGESDESTCRM